MRRFEFVGGASKKFWQIDVSGSGFTSSWGRIGTSGQSGAKKFADAAKAKDAADKLIAKKLAEGYREVKRKAAATAAPAPAPAPAAFKPWKNSLRRFENRIRTYWFPFVEISLRGNAFTVRRGTSSGATRGTRVFETGKIAAKTFKDPVAAQREAEKLIADKIAKGFKEVKVAQPRGAKPAAADTPVRDAAWIASEATLLRAAQERAKNKNPDPRSFQSLSLWGFDGVPKTFGPIAAFANLEELTFSEGKFPSVAPFAALKKLKSITVSRNASIPDPASLASLPALATLFVHSRKMASLSGLESVTFPSLRELYVEARLLPSFALLRGMPKLTKLSVSGDPKPGSGTALPSLEAIAKLPGFEELSVENCSVDDLKPLRPLKNLRRCDVDGSSRLGSISGLEGKPRLRNLGLSDTLVDDLKPIAGAKELDFVSIARTKIRDLSPLAQSVNLNYLDANDAPIEDVSPLAKLTKLTTLYLAGVPAKDFSALGKMTMLRDLDLHGVKAGSFDFLAGLKSLELLDLADTNAPVSICELLAKLPKLQKVRLLRTAVKEGSAEAKALDRVLAKRKKGFVSFNKKPDWQYWFDRR